MAQSYYRLILPLSLILFGFTLFSQDTIFMHDGTKLNSKVISIEIATIKYKKSNYLDGPEYIVAKTNIDSIRFSNGYSEVFSSTFYVLIDTIIYNAFDTAIVDTIIIDKIKFYMFKSTGYSHNHRHDLIADFTHFVKGSDKVKRGDVSFLFEIASKDFTMRSSISGSAIIIPFRFESSGSMRRYKKVINECLVNIVFVNIHHKVEVTKEQSEAFSKMFLPYYLDY